MSLRLPQFLILVFQFAMTKLDLVSQPLDFFQGRSGNGARQLAKHLAELAGQW